MPGVARVWGVTKTDIGLLGGQPVGDRRMGQGGDQGLALRGPGRDRGPSHAEPASLEVDVVQLVPVDEPPGGDVADLGVVLPAVPEAAHDLDEVGGLVEAARRSLLDHGVVVSARISRSGIDPSPELLGLEARSRDPDLHARPGRCST